jgi:hypothetical protein
MQYKNTYQQDSDFYLQQIIPLRDFKALKLLGLFFIDGHSRNMTLFFLIIVISLYYVAVKDN